MTGMSQWVRPLHQATPAAAQWHAPLTRSFATTTQCGKVLEGSIEVTNDNDKAERQGRCGACLTRIVTNERLAGIETPRPRPEPVAKTPVAKKPIAKKPIAKKPIAKKPIAKKPVAKKPVAKKPAVRRSGRRGA